MEESLHQYKEIKECEFKGRHYSVRDNGAVLRHQKKNSRPAPLDNVWTFGTKDFSSGYMMIAGIRVHQIVATAFHGPAPAPNLVVDHIDNNKCNNRPSNLHWVTRLENALNNPITRAKIELICGSIEAFIENPSILRGHENTYSPFTWMRTVTPEEAKVSHCKWLEWSKRPIEERKSKGGVAGEWLYESTTHVQTADSPIKRKVRYENPWARKVREYNEAYESLDSTPEGFRIWEIALVDRTEESIFPLAPMFTIGEEDVINKYHNSLILGQDFLLSRYYKTVFKDVVYFEEQNKLRVLSERINAQRTPLYIFEIWADDSKIYHKFVGSYSLNKPQMVQEAMHDLTKFNRQEWKYKNR